MSLISATARVADPDNVELEITLRATVGDWRSLLKQLPRDYPSWKVESVIRRAIEATVGRVETAHDVPDPSR